MSPGNERSVVPDVLGPGRGSSGIGFWLALVVLAVVLHELQWVLLPFVISGLIAFLCAPLVERLARRMPRDAAVAIVFLFFLGVASMFAFLGAPALGRELVRLVTHTQSIFETLARSAIGDQSITLFGKPATAPQLAQLATQSVGEWLEKPTRIAEFGATAFASGFGVILTLVLLFYFLWSGARVAQGLLWVAPNDQRTLIRKIWDRFDPILRRYFIGVIVVVIYATIAAYIGLGLVLGIHRAPFLAILTGVLELIPVVGPGASALIAGLVAVRHATDIGSILAYAIYAAALRLSIDQLIGPLVLGAAARLHPLLIIFSFLAGGALFGLPGVILGAPMILLLKVTLVVLREEPVSRSSADLEAEE